MENKIINNLACFVSNKGLIDPTRPPQINEPFYGDWMKEKIKHMELKCGDKLEITHLEQEETVVTTGVLINDCFDPLYLLTSGKKLWKTRANEKYIFTNYIVSIEKVEEASKDFDCKEVNPYYKTKEEQENANKKFNEKIFPVSEHEIEKFNRAYPEVDFKTCHILALHLNLYFPFRNAKIIGAEINIVKKDTSTIEIPPYKIKHIYPNKNHYSICGNESGSEELIIPFSTLEELNNIKYISCLWNIQIDDGGQFGVLYMTYPIFQESKGYNIYNVNSHETVLAIHEESLHKRTSFSGAIYTNYDFVGVICDEEDMYVISGADEENVQTEMVMALHNNNLLSVIASLSEEAIDQVEVFMKKETVTAQRFFFDISYKENHNRKEERLNFSKFLKANEL